MLTPSIARRLLGHVPAVLAAATLGCVPLGMLAAAAMPGASFHPEVLRGGVYGMIAGSTAGVCFVCWLLARARDAGDSPA